MKFIGIEETLDHHENYLHELNTERAVHKVRLDQQQEQINQIVNLITKHRQCMEGIVNRLDDREFYLGDKWNDEQLETIKNRNAERNAYQWISIKKEEPYLQQLVAIRHDTPSGEYIDFALYVGGGLFCLEDEDFEDKYVSCSHWYPIPHEVDDE